MIYPEEIIENLIIIARRSLGAPHEIDTIAANFDLRDILNELRAIKNGQHDQYGRPKKEEIERLEDMKVMRGTP